MTKTKDDEFVLAPGMGIRDLLEFKKPRLKEWCRKLGVNVSGKKAVLAKRIVENAPAQRGRRRALFENKVREKLFDAVRAGATWETAAQYAGISKRALRYNIKEAEKVDVLVEEGVLSRDELDPTQLFLLQFLHELRARESETEVRLLLAWNKHFDTDYRAVKDFMMARWPDRYNPKLEQRVEHSGKVENVQRHEVDLTSIPDEGLDALEELLQKYGKPAPQD